MTTPIAVLIVTLVVFVLFLAARSVVERTVEKLAPPRAQSLLTHDSPQVFVTEKGDHVIVEVVLPPVLAPLDLAHADAVRHFELTNAKPIKGPDSAFNGQFYRMGASTVESVTLVDAPQMRQKLIELASVFDAIWFDQGMLRFVAPNGISKEDLAPTHSYLEGWLEEVEFIF